LLLTHLAVFDLHQRKEGRGLVLNRESGGLSLLIDYGMKNPQVEGPTERSRAGASKWKVQGRLYSVQWEGNGEGRRSAGRGFFEKESYR